MKKNITIITGTRAEFGILTPILHALAKSKKLHPQLLVTGMHLQKQFGHTINDVKKSGIPIAATAEMYKSRDTPADSLSRATKTIAQALAKLKPDLLLLLGDRLEMLAAANAALALQLPIAHLHGGETAPGQWDEQIRHALTKLAHLHFPATKKAAQRIQQMGEPPHTIHPIGAPALDTIQTFLQHQSRSQPGAMFLAQPRGQKHASCAPANTLHPAALLLLHPTSPDNNLEEYCTLQTIHALQLANLPFTAIGPNNDPGHLGILRAYQKTNTSLTMNLSQQDFWQLLQHSSLLIGNSSAAIIESASFALPAINLGPRQKGRERNPNTLDIPWSASPNQIAQIIHYATTNKPFLKKVAQRKNLYGTGAASTSLVKILESLTFPLLTTKQFT